MRNSKLIRLLNRLNQKELKRFDKYIRSIHEPDSLSAILFKHLKRYYPTFEAKQIEKAYLIKSIFKGKDEKGLSNIASKLFGDLQNFLILTKLDSDSVQKDKLLIEIYRERKLNELMYNKTALTKKEIKKAPQSPLNYYDLMWLNHQEYYYAPQRKMISNHESLRDAIQHLENFYLLSKLKYQAEFKNRAIILEQGLSDIESNDEAVHTDELNPIKTMYEQLIQLAQFDTPIIYDGLKQLLFDQYSQLAQEDQLILLSYLINKASSRFRKGNADGILETFRLYQFGLEKEILIESGLIADDNFRNIVFVACEIQALKWASEFIKSYQKYLLEENKSDIVSLCWARINFAKKDFDVTQTYLNTINFKDTTYILLTKFIQVRCYYELRGKDDQLLRDSVKNFGTFLSRNKILNKGIIKSYLNFLAILKMIIRDHNKVSALVIEEKLEEKELISGKSWLLEKIRELPDYNAPDK